MTRRHRLQRFNPLRKIKSLYIWHRYAGLAAAVFVFILAITGIMLNHTERMQLDSSYVKSDVLLDWYGIGQSQVHSAYPLGKRWLVYMEDNLYLDTHRIDGHYANPPTGVLDMGEFFAVAMQENILLLTSSGEVVERLGRNEGVPGGIEKIGKTNQGQVVVQTDSGYFQSQADFLQWQQQAVIDQINWSEATDVPQTLRSELIQQSRHHELTWERVMLDLHSGRLFGAWGTWVMDLAAIFLIFLALSGSWLWVTQMIRKRQRAKKHKH